MIDKKRRIVRVGRRLLRVTWWTETGCMRGVVTPLFERPSRDLGVYVDETICKVKISHPDSEYRRAQVQQISVMDRKQRRGWGSAMVVALTKVFPDDMWEVSEPNEKSSALFNKLSLKHPTRIAPHVKHPWME